MITVNLNSSTPLNEQLCLGIRRAIAMSELMVGDPLPSVRQLANDLGINFNTVARAYRDLEKQGLLNSIRGRGTVVASNEETRREPEAVVERRLSEDLRDLLASAQLAGLPKEVVERIIRGELIRLWPTKEKGK